MSVKITCSILCYNYGRFLAQAIESCLSQTLADDLYEILIIDDGSTDNTPEICKLYGDRVRISRSENYGFATSLARGIEEARGEYVAYLDADDWWHPDKLAILLSYLEQGALLVVHPMFQVDEEGQVAENEIGSCGNTSSVCVKRDAALTLLPGTSELFCRPLLDCGKGRILEKALGYYRIHSNAMTDRSPTTTHTEFFARTSHHVADRLFSLAVHPPYWASSPSQLINLAKRYRAEGLIKEFERATEIGDRLSYPAKLFRMLISMAKARLLPSKRELRLIGRAIRQLI